MTETQHVENGEVQRLANVLGAFSLALGDKIARAIAEASDLGVMASAALIQIGQNPGLSIEQLRRFLGLSHSAAVRIIDQFERDGLAGRVRGAVKDSRVTSLSLSKEGEALMERMLAARHDVALALLDPLNDAERAALARLMDKTIGKIVDAGDDQDVVCRLCDLRTCPDERCPVTNAHPVAAM
ncbi:MAG: MarR family transcriptional regulator [Phyllobacteriaceae bacterium]|nr:MarR family transcriptional regulator [Phyllobacteriaceae bacterium]